MDYNIHPLKIIRVINNLTQEEMSQYFSVTKSYISAVENSKNVMDISKLTSGLEILGLTIDDYINMYKISETLKTQNISEQDKYKIMIKESAEIIMLSHKEKEQRTNKI